MLLRQIAESTDRAAHLINQLLILARAEASHEKLHQVVPVDLEAAGAPGRPKNGCRAAMAKRIDLGFEDCGWPLQVNGIPLAAARTC
jgi:two-component system sensor histidine kinase TctE